MSLSRALLHSRSLLLCSHARTLIPASPSCQARSLVKSAVNFSPAKDAPAPRKRSRAKKADDEPSGPTSVKKSNRTRKEPEIIVPPEDTLELPPINDWRSYFAVHQLTVRDRVSVRNPELAEKLAHSFLDSPHTASDQPKTVIEAFPGLSPSCFMFQNYAEEMSGPGQLSRALLKLPPSKLKKLIILEDHEPYLQYLRVSRLQFLENGHI